MVVFQRPAALRSSLIIDPEANQLTTCAPMHQDYHQHSFSRADPNFNCLSPSHVAYQVERPQRASFDLHYLNCATLDPDSLGGKPARPAWSARTSPVRTLAPLAPEPYLDSAPRVTTDRPHAAERFLDPSPDSACSPLRPTQRGQRRQVPPQPPLQSKRCNLVFCVYCDV